MESHPTAKFALVIAGSDLQDFSDRRQALGEFLANLQNSRPQPTSTKKLHDNVWLIDLSNGLPYLGSLTEWSHSSKLRLHILFLASEPDWITYPPDDEATP
jgi:hypothetical protein